MKKLQSNIRTLVTVYRATDLPFTWYCTGFASAIIIAAAMAKIIAANFYSIPQTYQQFIVGNITWAAENKSLDLVMTAGFILTFFIVYLLTIILGLQTERRFGSHVLNELGKLMLYSFIPAVFWLASLFLSAGTGLGWLVLSAGLVSSVIYLSFLIAYGNNHSFTCPQDYFSHQAKWLLLFILGIFSILAIGQFAYRIPAIWKFPIQTIMTAAAGAWLIAWLVLTAYFIWWNRKAWSALSLDQWLVALQVLMPLIFFALIPVPWQETGNKYYGYAVNNKLYFLIAGLIGFSWLEIIYRYRRTDRRQISLSFGCIIAILFFVKYTVTPVAYIHPDDYHMGESLLPWWSYQEFGQIPFWNYQPSRGLVNYGLGLVANLFFDGSAGAYLPAGNVLLLLYLILGFIGFSLVLGSEITFLCLLIYPLANIINCEIEMITTLVLIILCKLLFTVRYANWLIGFYILGVIILLYAPGQGGLMLLALAPIAGFTFFTHVKTEYKRILLSLAVLIGANLVLYMVMPAFFHMLYGAVRYVIEQGAINTVAYGLTWKKSFAMAAFQQNQWIVEFFRTMWLVITLVMGALFLHGIIKTNPQKIVTFPNAVVLSLLILSLLYIPKAAGRVDPDGISRIGLISLWAICFALPLWAKYTRLIYRYKMALLLLMVFFGGVLLHNSSQNSNKTEFDQSVSGIFPVNSPQALFLKPGSVAHFPDQFVSGKDSGLINIGTAYISQQQLTRLTNIQNILATVLQPDETYLDLTNRNAHYYYLNRRPVIETGAFYNLPHNNQQMRAVQILAKNPPPLILVEADNILHDGVKVSLRSHLLYRFALRADYTPVWTEGLVFMVRNDRLNLLPSKLLQQDALTAVPPDFDEASYLLANPDLAHTNIGAAQHFLQYGQYEYRRLSPTGTPHIHSKPKDFDTMGLKNIFAVKDLQKIPVAWGRSFEHLQPQLLKIQAISPEPSLTKDGEFVYRFAPAIAGQEAGLLIFDYYGLAAIADISAYTAQTEVFHAQATLEPGKIIIPLDMDPRWVQAKTINEIRIKLDDMPRESVGNVSNAALYQRKLVEQAKKYLE